MANDQANVESKVQAIIAEQLGISKEKVQPQASLESLGADSLDRVKIIMEVEEAFGIEIKDEEAEKISTVGEFIDYITKQVNK